ncbi:MAG TPA: GerAB/ArcD/ProY family transporter [Clostridia bacterium]|nr:GerAB/ArcD/ProY family transporter [Clostridia bacterium]
MRNDINNRQMMYILLITLTAITIISLPQTMAVAAGEGSWLTLILSSFIYAFSALMIVSLNKRFQGEVLFDYSKRLVGKVGSYVLGAFYAVYFLSISSYLCATMSNILVSNFFTRTPRWFVVLISIPFYGYAAYKGITSVGRLSEFYGVIYLVVTVSSFVLMFIQGDINNIRPLFIPQDTPSYLRAIKEAIPSFLGVEVLTLMPISGKDRKTAPKMAFLTVLGVGLFLVMTVESCIMMNGINEIKNQNNALIAAIRQIQIPALSFFERMDFMYLTVGFMGLFAAKTIVMLAALEYWCRLFPKVKRHFVVLVVMLAVFLTDLVLFNVNDLAGIYESIFLYAGNVSALVIPATLNILARAKRNVAQAG